MIGRRNRRGQRSENAGRRSGPPDEDRWWDPEDQRFVESELVPRRLLGRGWRAVPMPNNIERLDPHGSGPVSRTVAAVRTRRGLTALDEGRAWRRRSTGALLVLRAEMFAGDDSDHRRTWDELGLEVLRETWRERWAERGRRPGWIEARRQTDPEASRPEDEFIDRIRIEDHTGDDGEVLVYHHVTVWAGRFHAAVTMRVPLGEPEDPALLRIARELHRAGISRSSGSRRGFA